LRVFAEAGMISGDITTPFAEDGMEECFLLHQRGLFSLRQGEQYSATIPGSILLQWERPASGSYRDDQGTIWVGGCEVELYVLCHRVIRCPIQKSLLDVMKSPVKLYC